MKKVIPVLIMLLFILSVVMPNLSSVITEYFDGDNGVYITEDYIDDAPGMGVYWLYGDDDFGWTHIIDPECKNILSVTLEIGAWDVDCGPIWWNMDEVFADGDSQDFLTGDDMVFSVSTFSLNPGYLADGEVEIWIDIDTNEIDSKVMIEYSKLIVEWVPCLKVWKEIVDGSEDPPEFVPLQTPAWWDLEITVENPDDDYDEGLTGIWVYDGIGAKLDLVIQDPSGTPYIFKIDGTPIPLDGNGDEYYGEDVTEGLYWAQANNKPISEKKRCATVLYWYVGDLDDDDPAVTLEFRVKTYQYFVGKDDKNEKHAFTSVCHHELNDGSIGLYLFESRYYFAFGDPVYVSVYSEEEDADSDGDEWYDLLEVDIYGTDPCDPEDYPESFRLIEKDPDTWDPVHDPVTDGPYGILTYDPIGPTFDFDFEGWNLEPNEDYTLIYYADPWPGNNPGAFLGEDTTDGTGWIHITGGIGGIELNMDLPHPDDANHPYNSPAIPGAKIWLVLTDDYDDGTNSMTGWQPTSYIFEEETWDRVFYDDTDV